jgi:hypothetical protein
MTQRSANLPFPAVVAAPDGTRYGPARLDVRADPPRLRAFVVGVVDGRNAVVLDVDVALAEPVALPSRNQREWQATALDGGVWTFRKGGCACGARRLLVGFDPAAWDAAQTALAVSGDEVSE